MSRHENGRKHAVLAANMPIPSRGTGDDRRRAEVVHANILVVESKRDHGDAVAGAIATACMTRPARVRSSAEAVQFVSNNLTDVCVIDYDLPDANGVEALLRIHHRRPGLPVIMTSGAKSEQVAIDAFHAGATDYIPKTRGYQNLVALAVQKVLARADRGPLTTEVAQPVVEGAIPPDLLRPTYQNRLRAIGRQMDDFGYHGFNILEVQGGFIVRVGNASTREYEALEFPDEHLPHLVAAKITGRGRNNTNRANTTLLPTGSEDFLRALGYRLDKGFAEMVTIIELANYIVVGGAAPQGGTKGGKLVPFEWFLRGQEIEALLNDAYKRRGAAQPQKKTLFG
jgi:DNA-binding NarL/FixJ family response regulator